MPTKVTVTLLNVQVFTNPIIEKKINNWHRSTTGTQEVTDEHNQASSQQLPIARKSLRIDDLCDSGKTRRKARCSSRRGGVGGSDVSLLPRCHVAGIKALLVHYEADAIMKSFHPLTFAIYLATLRVGGGGMGGGRV